MKKIFLFVILALMIGHHQAFSETVDKSLSYLSKDTDLSSIAADPATLSFGIGCGSIQPQIKSYITLSEGNTLSIKVPSECYIYKVNISGYVSDDIIVPNCKYSSDGKYGSTNSWIFSGKNSEITFTAKDASSYSSGLSISHVYIWYYGDATEPVNKSAVDDVIECYNSSNQTFYSQYATQLRFIDEEGNYSDINCSESSSENYASYTVTYPQNVSETKITVYPIIKGLHYPDKSKTYTLKQKFSHSSSATYVNGLYYNTTSLTINSETKTVAQVVKDGTYRNYSSISIPESVEINGTTYSVGALAENAFNGCEFLTDIKLPSSLNYIGATVFSGCTSLKSLVIPDNVVTLSDNCFNGSSLESITFGSSVANFPTSIYSLSTINDLIISESNPNFARENDQLYKLVSFSETDNRKYLVYLLKQPKDDILILADNANGIVGNALKGKSFSQVIYPANLTSYGSQIEQLGGAKIGKFVIPGNVTYISSATFRYSDIDTLVIEAGDTPLIMEPYDGQNNNWGAFHGSSFKKIVINRDLDLVNGYGWPKSYTKAFYRSNVTDVIEINCSLGIKAAGAFNEQWTTPGKVILGPNVESICALGLYDLNELEIHARNVVDGPLNTTGTDSNNTKYDGFKSRTVYVQPQLLDDYKSIYSSSKVLPLTQYCNIWFNEASKTVNPGTNFYIGTETNPSDIELTWSSNNPTVATVSEDGQISALKEGVAIITAKGSAAEYSDLSASIVVNVTSEDIIDSSKAYVTLQGLSDHSVRLAYNKGQNAVIEILPDEGWSITTVSLNGTDVTNSLVNDVLTISNISGDNNVSVVLSSGAGSKEILKSNKQVNIVCNNDSVEVIGLDDNEEVSIYDVNGLLIYKGSEHYIKLAQDKVYILKTNYRNFKFML